VRVSKTYEKNSPMYNAPTLFGGGESQPRTGARIALVIDPAAGNIIREVAEAGFA
jgi:hypothetical protein